MSGDINQKAIVTPGRSDYLIASVGGATKRVNISIIRERLTANRTYYIRLDGSDSNDGLTNNSGGAFLNLQHALDVVVGLDFNNHVVIIQLADGDYSDQEGPYGPGYWSLSSSWLPGSRDALKILGNSGDHSAVIIPGGEYDNPTPNRLTIEYCTVKGWIDVWEGCLFEPRNLNWLPDTRYFSGTSGIALHDAGCRCVMFGDWVINGKFSLQTWAADTYFQWGVNSVTADGTVSPATDVGSQAFINVGCGSCLVTRQTTFTGTFTGKRFSILDQGLIDLGGKTGGINFFPGDEPGTVGENGCYSFGSSGKAIRSGGAYSKQVPSTGFSITIDDGIEHLILVPAGTLATGTVTLPANVVDGQVVTIKTTQIITALTVLPNSGQSLAVAPSTLAAGGLLSYRYCQSTTTWY